MKEFISTTEHGLAVGQTGEGQECFVVAAGECSLRLLLINLSSGVVWIVVAMLAKILLNTKKLLRSS